MNRNVYLLAILIIRNGLRNFRKFRVQLMTYDPYSYLVVFQLRA